MFELLGDVLGLLVTLEPGLILLMEAPTLVSERLGSEVLLIRPLTVVEKVEESIRVNSPGIV